LSYNAGDDYGWAFCSKDAYLIRIMQKDFNARLNYTEKRGKKNCMLVTKRDDDYMTILDILGLDCSDELDVLGKLKLNVNTYDICPDNHTKTNVLQMLEQWIENMK
jgi:hypothetical protein